MASNIFYTKPFQRVVQCDVAHTNFATDEGEKRIVQLAQKVIHHLHSSELQKGEKEQLSQFIEKVHEIDDKLHKSGRGAELRTCAHTLKVLEGLRTGLSPDHQEIAKDAFILYLSVSKDYELDNPLDRMVELADFLENQLLPALKNAQNLQELKALEPLVNDCISLIERLENEPVLGDAVKTMETHRKELADLWNVRYLQENPSYQRLLTYRKGELGNLFDLQAQKENIQGIFEHFKKIINHPALTREEKIAVFRAIQIIESEFAACGIPVEFSAEKAFFFFLKNDVLPAIENAKSLQELTALRQTLRSCNEIAKRFNHPKINSFMDNLAEAYQAKLASFTLKEKSVRVKKPVVELPTSKQDLAVLTRLSKAIIDLKPTISDANAYPFSAAHGQYIDEAKSKSGALGMLAAGMRLHSEKKRYSDSPKEILKLGQDLLRDKSGVCDHMAAAVIAKIVEHIRSGGQWDADVELVGNGAHAFIAVNRPHGDINDLDNWKGAIVVDTWLGAIGVHPKYQSEIPSPKDGVISNSQQVEQFANFFGSEGRMIVTRRFSAEELRALAQGY